MKSLMKKLSHKFLDMEKPQLFDWIIFCGIMLFCYFVYNHGDILATATHGKDLVECILNGNFFGFYDYTQSTAVYSITVYILFAIWSIPVFMVYAILGIPMWGVTHYTAIPYEILMWYKLLPTLFYFGIAVLIYKIIIEIKQDKNLARWGFYLFVASPIAMFSQFLFGQYDSLGLFFTVLAFYFFIKKKYYWFSAIISLAATFKLFAFFLFIPLIVLVEKRLLHLIKHGVIAISGYVITTMMFSGSAGYGGSEKFCGNIVPRLFNIGVDTSLGVISFFTVAMMAICVIAYNKKIENDDEYYSYAIFISFFVYATMFMFVLWHPQWVIYVVPFMTLAFFLNTNTNSALILHSAMSVGYLVSTVFYWPDNVDTSLLYWGILTYIYPEGQRDSIAPIFTMGDTLNSDLYFSLFAGSLAILIAMYIPTRERVKRISISKTKEFNIGNREFIWLRILTLLVFIVPTLYKLFR